MQVELYFTLGGPLDRPGILDSCPEQLLAEVGGKGRMVPESAAETSAPADLGGPAKLSAADAAVAAPTTLHPALLLVSSPSREESSRMELPQGKLRMEIPADASDDEVSGILDWFRLACTPEPPMQGWPGGDAR